jgi:NAD(P)-dependent dehydrogenase (short-subunit alcohol dehydrogenase family)
MAGRLAGKSAIVFGAGCIGPGWGNGKATAVLFAREGARVTCVDRNLAAAEETASIIAGEGGQALAVRCDVTVSAEVAGAIARHLEAFGRIDVLHNNVGICEPGGPVEVSEESWRRVMDANVTSMFLTCRHALPVMEAQAGGGAIVNVSSVASLRYSWVPWVSYAASKGAVNQLTQAVACQYAAKGIRCNAVAPGLIDTPMIVEPHRPFHPDLEAMRRARDAQVPMGRQGTAWDVAKAALFLASDEAAYITGALLVVDGGLSAVVPRPVPG